MPLTKGQTIPVAWDFKSRVVFVNTTVTHPITALRVWNHLLHSKFWKRLASFLSWARWSHCTHNTIFYLPRNSRCVLSLIYARIYVAVGRFFAVRCLFTFVSICYCLITRLMFFNTFLRFFLFRVLFSILYIKCFCIFLCIVSPFVYSYLFPIFVQVYPPLPLGGNPIAVNKYHISQHILWYIISDFPKRATNIYGRCINLL
jgi:hypothetical protein